MKTAKRHVWTEETDFYKRVFESFGQAVLITDPEDRILNGNPALEQMTGYRISQLRYRFAYEVFLDESEWAFMRGQNNERMLGESAFYKIRLKMRSGESKMVSVRAVPFVDEDGEPLGTIGSMVDCEREETLKRENAIMRDELAALKGRTRIIGESPALKAALQQASQVAGTDANVLILGESGCGKELFASAIHERSHRASKQVVRVNCAAIPKELFESEFFGHLKGAFTGAVKTRVGRFELANGSTLFLDEVGEIPLDMQGKLLRALQEGTFEPIGDDRTRQVDVRIVAATNIDLKQAVKEGRFREDLFFRLNVFPITVPPLRARGADILLIADYLLKRIALRLGVPVSEIPIQEKKYLMAYRWPGNVRELENSIERALILKDPAAPLRFPELRDGEMSETETHMNYEAPDVSPKDFEELQSMEIAMIQRALAASKGKVHGSSGAAARLRIKPTTLASKINKLGLQ